MVSFKCGITGKLKNDIIINGSKPFGTPREYTLSRTLSFSSAALSAVSHDISPPIGKGISATTFPFLTETIPPPSSRMRFAAKAAKIRSRVKNAKPWRKVLCNPYFSTIITLLFGFVLTKIGYANIWPLFGSANQLLSALVLITLCVFMKVTGRSNKMLFPPMIIMLCVTFTALVQRLIAMVKAISTAAAVTIPAGETTWGKVFLNNGLQLVIAVLLIVLGLTIVINSMKSYVKSKKNSEKKEEKVNG